MLFKTASSAFDPLVKATYHEGRAAHLDSEMLVEALPCEPARIGAALPEQRLKTA
jgi:hypothetical protein